MIWIQAITAAVVCGAILLDVSRNKNKKKLMCDSCKYLARKNRRRFGEFRYVCDCSDVSRHFFDVPPEYCGYYKSRTEDENG